VLPAALIVAFLASVLDRSASAAKERALFDAQEVRCETGLGAEMAVAH
jgi:cation/acetate symporter